MSRDVLVVGGGIAGLSAAWALAQAGAGRITLLEREPLLCMHSSGRNAAIFRQLVSSRAQVALSLRSRVLLDSLFGGERAAWLRPTGSLLVATRAEALAPLVQRAKEAGVRIGWRDAEALRESLPWLRGGGVRAGLWVPEDGVLDVHAIAARLEAALRGEGVELRRGAEVARVLLQDKRVGGVQLVDGSVLEAPRVVLAAGAWAAALGAGCGAPQPLRPLRRHLVQLAPTGTVDAQTPVVWCVDEEAYVRPESGGLLASPCDEAEEAPGVPQPRAEALELLAAKLSRLAPGLSGASVVRSWACLRTFAPDREPVVGEDARVPGLYWLAGLGGHGMTGGLAAGELLAKQFPSPSGRGSG